MTLYHQIIVALWLGLTLYWAVSAISAKRNVGPRNWWKGRGVRLLIILFFLLVARLPALRHTLSINQEFTASHPLMGLGGVALCALGLGLAVYARVYLGRNWGMPMSQKENPELVTTGPYAAIRHPIYTGLLLAMVGSAIGASVFWVLPLVVFGAYFIYSARREEKLMIEQFPQEYPAYMRRSKMLVPFLF